MNTAGWMLTENGRQPWIVQGLQLTKQGVSPSISATTVWISLIVFVLLYGVLAVVDGVLMTRFSRRAADPTPPLDDRGRPEPAMAY
jgi:cytochrome d ubiquinol oxidase subunit I